MNYNASKLFNVLSTNNYSNPSRNTTIISTVSKTQNKNDILNNSLLEGNKGNSCRNPSIGIGGNYSQSNFSHSNTNGNYASGFFNFNNSANTTSTTTSTMMHKSRY